jgi:basic amino acid/polyamine antiporter, APA family
VSVAMLVLRRRDPDAKRTFRTPLAWVVGPVAILGCLYLFASLPVQTQFYFLMWNIVGLAFYFGYGRARSLII